VNLSEETGTYRFYNQCIKLLIHNVLVVSDYNVLI